MLGVFIFLLIFSGQIINWIGKKKLNDWAHELYLFLARSPLSKNLRELRKTVLKTKVEFQSTSSQDEFAKWARLRRKMDKEVAELDALNKQIATAKIQFSALFSSLLWTFTTGFQFVLISWHRKSPVFFLPQDWFPPAIVWILSFPSAPYGAVSTTVWTMICKRALAMAGGILSDSFGIFAGLFHSPVIGFHKSPLYPCQADTLKSSTSTDPPPAQEQPINPMTPPSNERK